MTKIVNKNGTNILEAMMNELEISERFDLNGKKLMKV